MLIYMYVDIFVVTFQQNGCMYTVYICISVNQCLIMELIQMSIVIMSHDVVDK